MYPMRIHIIGLTFSLSFGMFFERITYKITSRPFPRTTRNHCNSNQTKRKNKAPTWGHANFIGLLINSFSVNILLHTVVMEQGTFSSLQRENNENIRHKSSLSHVSVGKPRRFGVCSIILYQNATTCCVFLRGVAVFLSFFAKIARILGFFCLVLKYFDFFRVWHGLCVTTYCSPALGETKQT